MREEEEEKETMELDDLAPAPRQRFYLRRVRPGHRVLKQPPEPAKDRADRELIERYSALLEEIPLRSHGMEQLQAMERQLHLEFPWFGSVIDSILRQQMMHLALAPSGRGQSKGVFRLRPLLLVGPPGSGKTRFIRRLAELAALPHLLIPVGGSSDNRMIAGTARGWSTGQPSELLRVILTGGVANPLVALDELDKEGEGSHNGKLTHTLHQLLEGENARNWHDEFLLADSDLSPVNWIATANRADNLEQSLLSRFQLIEVGLPKGEQLISVVHGVRRDLAEEYGVPLDHLPQLSPLEWDYLLDRFERGNTSPRAVGRLVRGLMERAVMSPGASARLH